jgi:hypothetical protein
MNKIINLIYFLCLICILGCGSYSYNIPSNKIPDIEKIVVKSQLEPGKKHITTNKQLIENIYNCLPYDKATELGHAIDYNAAYEVNFINKGVVSSRVFILYNYSAFEVKGKKMPCQINGDVSKYINDSLFSNESNKDNSNQ